MQVINRLLVIGLGKTFRGGNRVQMEVRTWYGGESLT